MDKKAHKKNRKGFLIIFLKEEYTFCVNVYSEKELQRITKQRQHGSEWTDDCHHLKNYWFYGLLTFVSFGIHMLTLMYLRYE